MLQAGVFFSHPLHTHPERITFCDKASTDLKADLSNHFWYLAIVYRSTYLHTYHGCGIYIFVKVLCCPSCQGERSIMRAIGKEIGNNKQKKLWMWNSKEKLNTSTLATFTLLENYPCFHQEPINVIQPSFSVFILVHALSVYLFCNSFLTHPFYAGSPCLIVLIGTLQW